MLDYSQMLNGHQFFIAASERNLCNLVNHAKKKIAFIGSGLPDSVCRELIAKKDLVEKVVIDSKEKVFKTGYGEVVTLRKLKESGINLQGVDGLKINVLLVDDRAIVYSPTPLAIEAPVDSVTPNGIFVEAASVEPLFGKIFENKKRIIDTEAKQVTVVSSNEKEETVEGLVLKTQPITISEINDVEKAIEKDPPRFDLDRRLNVYQACLQYVEITAVSCDLKKFVLPIPQRLMNLASGTEAQGKIHSSYTLFPDRSRLVENSRKFMSAVRKMRTDYTESIPGFGVFVLKSQYPDLEKEYNRLLVQLEKLKADIVKDAEKENERTIREITRLLQGIVARSKLPEIICVERSQRLNCAKALIRDEIERVLVPPEKFIEKMTLKLTPKDITREMLDNQELNDKLKKSRFRFYLKTNGLFKESRAVEEEKGELNLFDK